MNPRISTFVSDVSGTGLLTPVHEFGIHLIVDQSGKPKSPAPGDAIFKPRLTRDDGTPLTAEELTRVKYTSLDLPEWLQLDSKTGEVKVRDTGNLNLFYFLDLYPHCNFLR